MCELMVNKGSNFKSEIEGRVEKYQDSLKVKKALDSLSIPS